MLRELLNRFIFLRLKAKQRVSLPGSEIPGYGSKSTGTTSWIPPLRNPNDTPDAAFAALIVHAAKDKAEWIRFDKQGLTIIPPSIASLDCLRTLELKGNLIREIPDAIGDLIRLETLTVSGGQVRVVSDAIGRLKHLMILGLSTNQIEALPNQIGEASSLRELHLGGNRLRSIPETVGRLKELIKLNLSNNSMRDIPRSLLDCTKLEFLYLHDNPELHIPESVLGPSWMAVFSGTARSTSPREILNWYFSNKR
jgi:Leucine-rich repeat (LRR) protein